MVGPWPLAPHHDLITIFTSFAILIQWGQNRDITDQLEIDGENGIEIGHTIKKFPFLTAREYVLSWRVWEGKEKGFYYLIKVA